MPLSSLPCAAAGAAISAAAIPRIASAALPFIAIPRLFLELMVANTTTNLLRALLGNKNAPDWPGRQTSLIACFS